MIMVLTVLGIVVGTLGVAFGIFAIGYWIGYTNGIAVKNTRMEK
jgi:hypothetical protein